jgi:REP element-mobilizing transposase RayT
MPVKQNIPFSEGIFSITFTCSNWLPLLGKVNGYNIVYKWFDYLKSKGHYIIGFVIMPNHVHAVIGFRRTFQSINAIIGNGKRFMAYEIITRLEEHKETDLLNQLSSSVETARKEKMKLHNVWELSFDWKKCETTDFVIQKLDYFHINPCKGKWNLCESPVDYVHSSAKFYITGEQGVYEITGYTEVLNIDLTVMREDSTLNDATSRPPRKA